MSTITTPQTAPTPAPTSRAGTRWHHRASRLAEEALRVSLALLLIWFGALKITGASAVTDLVASTVDDIPLITGDLFVSLVGFGEVALGLWLLVGRPRALVLSATALHLMTASLVAVAVRPDLVFQGAQPILLTVTGQFVVKNLALVFATAVLALHTLTRTQMDASPSAAPTRRGHP